MNKEDFYRLIESRKSIRKYRPDLPPKEVIERILNAATHAPSGKNRQNWKFFVVTGDKRNEYLHYSQKSFEGIKAVLQKQLKPSLYEFTERFFYTLGEAPVIIFCYSCNSSEEKHLTSVGSVYMAVQNICLSALVEGLGTCTMGAPLEIKQQVDQFLNLQNLPDYKSSELELLCAVTLGYPDHNPPKAPRKLEGRINWIS